MYRGDLYEGKDMVGDHYDTWCLLHQPLSPLHYCKTITKYFKCGRHLGHS